MKLDAEIVNFGQKWVLFNNGQTAPITNFFDDFGDEVSSHTNATSFVAGPINGQWFSDRCDSYDLVTKQ